MILFQASLCCMRVRAMTAANRVPRSRCVRSFAPCRPCWVRVCWMAAVEAATAGDAATALATDTAETHSSDTHLCMRASNRVIKVVGCVCGRACVRARVRVTTATRPATGGQDDRTYARCALCVERGRVRCGRVRAHRRPSSGRHVRISVVRRCFGCRVHGNWDLFALALFVVLLLIALRLPWTRQTRPLIRVRVRTIHAHSIQRTAPLPFDVAGE